jgi:DNA-binding transcriptional MocR family regulator
MLATLPFENYGNFQTILRAATKTRLQVFLHNLINGEKLRPGDPLPSESTLPRKYDVKRSTIRGVAEVLRNEGIVVTAGLRLIRDARSTPVAHRICDVRSDSGVQPGPTSDDCTQTIAAPRVCCQRPASWTWFGRALR